MLYNIIRLNRDIRVIGNIRERMPYRKTPIDNYSKLKTRIIKNLLGDEVTFTYIYCSTQPCLASCQLLAYLLGFMP